MSLCFIIIWGCDLLCVLGVFVVWLAVAITVIDLITLCVLSLWLWICLCFMYVSLFCLFCTLCWCNYPAVICDLCVAWILFYCLYNMRLIAGLLRVMQLFSLLFIFCSVVALIRVNICCVFCLGCASVYVCVICIFFVLFC